MKKVDFLIKKLKEFGSSDISSITNMFYNEYPDIVEQKRLYYIEKGEEKNDIDLKKQIYAEFGASPSGQYSKIYFKSDKSTSPITWSLTDEGVKKYYELFGQENIEFTDQEVDNIIKEENEDVENIENNDNIGDVYFATTIYSDTIKIGEGLFYDKRMITLKTDRLYKFFQPKMKYFIKLKNYKKLEDTLHAYFDDLRISKDAELFKNVDEKEFINFLKVNYIDNPRFKNDIVEHNLPL